MGGSAGTGAMPDFTVLGTIMTVSFIVFIVIGFLSGITKRLGKNIYNLIAFVLSAGVTAILGSFIYKNIIGNPVIQKIILELLGEVGDLAGTLLATGESMILLVVSAISLPLLFLVVYASIKFLMLVIRVCVPDLNNLMKKKVGNTRIKIGWKKRLIGGFIGLFIGASVFFALNATPMAIFDLAYTATQEIPAILLEVEDNQSAKNDSGLTTFSAQEETGGEEGSINETLSGVITGINTTKSVVDPICKSFPFAIYKGIGINKICEGYLNNSSSLKYDLHGKTFETKIYTDVKGLLKGAVVFSSYFLLEAQEPGLGGQTYTSNEIGESVYGILRNNFVIEIVDPVIKGLVHELCVTNFDLTEEDTTSVVETIKLNEFIDMSDAQKLGESKKITNFFIDFLTAVPNIGNEDIEVLEYIAEFGAIMDDMASTYSFAKTPGKLISAFIHGNEKIKSYISNEALDLLVNNVENKKCTYTQCLVNIKVAYKIAVAMVEKDKGEDVDVDTLKEDFSNIYNHSNEGVKEVVVEIVEKAVDKIDTTIDTEKITHTIIKDYFDNIYDYAEQLKSEADDETKIQEAEEKFKHEANGLSAIVDLIKEISAGEEMSFQTVENFAGAVVDSKVVSETVRDIKESQDADIVQVQEELKEIYAQTPQTVKQQIENELNQRIENATTNEAKYNISMLKEILGIE